MVDSDFHSIQPVESLPNIQGLTPAERRKERKNRQNGQAGREKDDTEQNEVEQEQPFDEDNGHAIDYCA